MSAIRVASVATAVIQGLWAAARSIAASLGAIVSAPRCALPSAPTEMARSMRVSPSWSTAASLIARWATVSGSKVPG